MSNVSHNSSCWCHAGTTSRKWEQLCLYCVWSLSKLKDSSVCFFFLLINLNTKLIFWSVYYVFYLSDQNFINAQKMLVPSMWSYSKWIGALYVWVADFFQIVINYNTHMYALKNRSHIDVKHVFQNFKVSLYHVYMSFWKLYPFWERSKLNLCLKSYLKPNKYGTSLYPYLMSGICLS